MTEAIRSLLFVPATRPDLVSKLARIPADAVVLDLEDTVPAPEKERARDALRDLLALFPTGGTHRPKRYVRINPVGTSWFDEDIRRVSAAPVDGVVVPKLSSTLDVEQVANRSEQAGWPGLPVIGGIETANGVSNVEQLVSYPVTGVYFGAEDFLGDMGGRRTSGGTEVLYARSRVALAARVGGIVALDQVVFDVRDEQAFRADAETGRAIGYAGKMCIHPSQVEWANQVFAPTPEELDWARRALSAYAEAEARGEGVAVLDGALVDMPAVRRARRLMAESGVDGADDASAGDVTAIRGP